MKSIPIQTKKMKSIPIQSHESGQKQMDPGGGVSEIKTCMIYEFKGLIGDTDVPNPVSAGMLPSRRSQHGAKQGCNLEAQSQTVIIVISNYSNLHSTVNSRTAVILMERCVGVDGTSIACSLTFVGYALRPASFTAQIRKK